MTEIMGVEDHAPGFEFHCFLWVAMSHFLTLTLGVPSLQVLALINGLLAPDRVDCCPRSNKSDFISTLPPSPNFP